MYTEIFIIYLIHSKPDPWMGGMPSAMALPWQIAMTLAME